MVRADTERLLRGLIIVALFAVGVVSGCGENAQPHSCKDTEQTTTFLGKTEDEIIRERLRQNLPEFDLNSVPFENAIKFVSDFSQTNIHVKWSVLETAGIHRRTPVHIDLKDTTFEKVILAILDDVGGAKVRLGYAVRNKTILISTIDDLYGPQITKTYDIRSLLAPMSGDNKEDWPSREELAGNIIELIEATVAPESWRPDGVGSISEKDGRLIVVQTEENHRSLKDLLEQLREMRRMRIRLAIRMFYLPKAEDAKLLKKTALKLPAIGEHLSGWQLSTKQVADFLRDVKTMKSVEQSEWNVALSNGQRVYIPKGRLPQSIWKAANQAGRGPPSVEATAYTDEKHVKHVCMTMYLGIVISEVTIPHSPPAFSRLPFMSSTLLDMTVTLPDGRDTLIRAAPGNKLTGGFWLLVHPEIILNRDKSGS